MLSNGYSRGVTLVETLVAFAIVSVCIALLIPAVQSARATARRTECASNMRQFHAGHVQSLGRNRINLCPDSIDSLGFFRNLVGLRDPSAGNSTHATFEMFEHNGAPLFENPHSPPDMNPETWFTEANIDAGLVLPIVDSYIARARHIGNTANYLFLDGHIEVIDANIVEGWANSGYNFTAAGAAKPPR